MSVHSDLTSLIIEFAAVSEIIKKLRLHYFKKEKKRSIFEIGGLSR